MCQMSRVTCHMSNVTCHMSHVPCHMSHVKKKPEKKIIQFVGASLWGVCYQRGLPRLVLLLVLLEILSLVAGCNATSSLVRNNGVQKKIFFFIKISEATQLA